jgi:hypothetical protein
MVNQITDAERAEMFEILAQFTRDSEFLNANWLDWLERYPDQWVGVYQERVLGYRDTLEDIILLARESGVPPGQGAFRYLDSSPTEMLLCGRWH